MTSHKTKEKLDWRAVTMDTPDVDDIWGEDMRKLLAEHLPTDDNGDPPGLAVNRLAEAARLYRAWKASDLPSRPQVKKYLRLCRDAAKRLQALLKHMDPESHRMLVSEAEKAGPTSFDPRNVDDIGGHRVFQSVVVGRRLAEWLVALADMEPRQLRPNDGVRHLVGEVIDIWEHEHQSRFTRRRAPMEYLHRVCQQIDENLSEETLEHIAREWLSARGKNSPEMGEQPPF